MSLVFPKGESRIEPCSQLARGVSGETDHLRANPNGLSALTPQCLLRHVKCMASVLEVSKQTAFSAHSKLAAPHLFGRRATSSVSLHSTIPVMLSTKASA